MSGENSKVFVRKANWKEHDKLCALARTSKHTSSFSNYMFSNEKAYEKGWIRVLVRRSDSKRLGLTCVRHKKREPATVLYFIVLTPEARGQGYGELLVQDLIEQSPHKQLKLNVAKENEEAVKFWKEQGFKTAGDSLSGKGYAMVKDW